MPNYSFNFIFLCGKKKKRKESKKEGREQGKVAWKKATFERAATQNDKENKSEFKTQISKSSDSWRKALSHFCHGHCYHHHHGFHIQNLNSIITFA